MSSKLMAPRHLSRHTPPALRDSAVRLGRHSRGSAADADDMNGRLWSGEDQTNSDPDGNAGTVVAEEVFMQHVTRVYKVNKHVWDYYSRLAAQQAYLVTSTTEAPVPAVDHSLHGREVPWDDPATFRYRSTFDDMPANLLPQARTLTTISSRAATQGSLAARSRPLSAMSRPLAAISRQLTATGGTPTPRAQSATHSLTGIPLTDINKDDSTTAVSPLDPAADGYYLRLRPSIFGLPVLSPEHKAAWFWSILMLVMDMVYIAFAMPLSAAFCPVVLGGLNWCSSVDLAAGLLYCMNLVVLFQIGFVLEHDYKKRVLLDGIQVARFYILRGSFFIDVMAVIPVMYQVVMVSAHVENPWANRCLTFTMFLRLMRLAQLMKLLFVDSLITSGTNGMSRYISVLGQYALVALYAIAVLVHNLACLAWIVALIEGLDYSWAAKVTWVGGPKGIEFASMPEQYLAAVYWVITTATGTGYGDITPNSPGDALLAILFMMCGVGMVALLIGSIAELLTQATSDARRAHAFRQKIMEVDEWLQRRNLPSKLSRAVTNYYNQVWLQHRDHPTEAAILSELPPYLRGRVASHITAGLLDGVEVTRGLEQTIKEQLASRLVPVEVAPGHELCREGDEADSFWLLQEGEMVRMRARSHQVDLIRPPCWLGESCLLAAEYPQLGQRPATLRALSSCQLWQLSLREANTLMTNHPELGKRMLEAARQAVLFYVSSGAKATGEPVTQQLQQWGHVGRPYASENGVAPSSQGQRPLTAKSMPLAYAVQPTANGSMQQLGQAGAGGRHAKNMPLPAGHSLGNLSVPAAAAAALAHQRMEPMIVATRQHRRTSDGLPDLATHSVPPPSCQPPTAVARPPKAKPATWGMRSLPFAAPRNVGSAGTAFKSSFTFPPLGRKSVPAAFEAGAAPGGGSNIIGSVSSRSRGSSAAPALQTIYSMSERRSIELPVGAGQEHPLAQSRLAPQQLSPSQPSREVTCQSRTGGHDWDQQPSGDMPSAFADPGLAVRIPGVGPGDSGPLDSPHTLTTPSSSGFSGMHGT